MTLHVRSSKSIVTTGKHSFNFIKVRLTFLSKSFHQSQNYPFVKTNTQNCTNNSIDCTEFHFKNLIFSAIERNYWAFCYNTKPGPNPLQDRFQAVIFEPELFTRVLSSIKEHPRIALRFFHWVEKQPGFTPSDNSFIAILEILVESNLMNRAYPVMEKMVCGNLNGVVNSLIDGNLNANIAAKLLDFMLFFLAKKVMVEQCLWVFNKMVESKFLPDVKNCNRLLKMLRDKKLVHKRKQVYSMMNVYHIEPNIITYNTLLDSYCKEGEVGQALNLLERCKQKAVNPMMLLIMH